MGRSGQYCEAFPRCLKDDDDDNDDDDELLILCSSQLGGSKQPGINDEVVPTGQATEAVGLQEYFESERCGFLFPTAFHPAHSVVKEWKSRGDQRSGEGRRGLLLLLLLSVVLPLLLLLLAK
jgi:hypothetical protein